MPGHGTLVSPHLSFSFEYSRALSAGSIAGAPLSTSWATKRLAIRGEPPQDLTRSRIITRTSGSQLWYSRIWLVRHPSGYSRCRSRRRLLVCSWIELPQRGLYDMDRRFAAMVRRKNKQLIKPADLPQSSHEKGSVLKSAICYRVESWSTRPKAQIPCSL
jgi:hypothetical protein